MLERHDYLAGRSLATVVFLALKLRRPLFLEGDAGLIRLQCYEGLDISSAVYEWNYPAQMLEIRLAEAEGIKDRSRLEGDIFSEKHLIRRPVLQALSASAGGAPVFLIDELDRTDEAFEAFLLEILSDYQVTIPELGTVKADEPPIVIITTNRTREVHDALKRRCLYHWVDYPSLDLELEIIRRKVPDCNERFSREIVAYVQKLRRLDLFKNPGIAETIDWATALTELDKVALDPETIADTIGALLKYQDDIARIQGSEGRKTLDEVRAEQRAVG
jgi:MoxR-like ATPase